MSDGTISISEMFMSRHPSGLFAQVDSALRKLESEIWG